MVKQYQKGTLQIQGTAGEVNISWSPSSPVQTRTQRTALCRALLQSEQPLTPSCPPESREEVRFLYGTMTHAKVTTLGLGGRRYGRCADRVQAEDSASRIPSLPTNGAVSRRPSVLFPGSMQGRDLPER